MPNDNVFVVNPNTLIVKFKDPKEPKTRQRNYGRRTGGQVFQLNNKLANKDKDIGRKA